LGENGVRYVDLNQVIQLPVPKKITNIVSVIGAGDSFLGGYVSSVYRN
jgi:sugar/nucleoside kinase (ribokinase family)